MRRTRMLLVLLVPLLLGSALPARAASDTTMAPRRLFEQSRASIGLVSATFTASVTVPVPVVSAASQRALTALLTQKVQRGEIAGTSEAVRDAFLLEVAHDPDRWLTQAGQLPRRSAKLTLFGSGFAISPDGYVVTNAHVVAPKDLKALLVNAALRSRSSQNAIDESDLSGVPRSIQTAFVAALERWVTTKAATTGVTKDYEVLISSGSGNRQPVRHTASLVVAGTPLPGKDVAVLHLYARNMATVPLGDDTMLDTGDRLFVVGYPAPATFNPLLSSASQREPTLTQGVVSAKKSLNKGYTVLQTDATMTHGNSGGPVFDDQGRVVGVATFGSVDPETGQEVAGLNFAIPVSIVRQFLAKAHVAAAEGPTSRKFNLALDDFDKHWYKRALPLFNAVKQLDPGHPLVDKFIRDSQAAIKQGRDRTPREILGLPIALAAGLVAATAVLLALLLILPLRRARRRAARRTPAQAAGVPAMFAPSSPPPPPRASLPPGISQSWSAWSPNGQSSDPDATQPLPRPPAHTRPPVAAQPQAQPRVWDAPTGSPPPPSSAPNPSSWFFEPSSQSPPVAPAGPTQPHQRTTWACPRCGHRSPPTARYCEQCWSDLNAAEPLR